LEVALVDVDARDGARRDGEVFDGIGVPSLTAADGPASRPPAGRPSWGFSSGPAPQTSTMTGRITGLRCVTSKK
jgi:hypothetical protein